MNESKVFYKYKKELINLNHDNWEIVVPILSNSKTNYYIEKNRKKVYYMFHVFENITHLERYIKEKWKKDFVYFELNN